MGTIPTRARTPHAVCAAVLIGMLNCSLSARAAETSVETFYKGRTIQMLVGFAPGGINDIAARLVGRHLPRFLPGAPQIVVQNQPGAGGLAVANYIYNVAPKDGTVLASLDRGSPQLAIQGEEAARFDPLKFTWLGSISSYANDAYLLMVNASSPVISASQLQKPGVPIKLGAVGAGSSNLVFSTLAKDVLKLNIDVVRGYTGAAPLFLAMQSGELDGQVVGLSSTRAGQADLWNSKKLRPLVQFGRVTRLAELPDVPTGRELAADDTARALVEFAEMPFFMALPFVAPPDIPADRAKALQDGFIAMCKDPQFVAEAERLGLDVSPVDAQALLQLLRTSAATPKSVIEAYRAILSPTR
jgi:tripartite-type tricarboxylate transporter receptor subunit TctC